MFPTLNGRASKLSMSQDPSQHQFLKRSQEIIKPNGSKIKISLNDARKSSNFNQNHQTLMQRVDERGGLNSDLSDTPPIKGKANKSILFANKDRPMDLNTVRNGYHLQNKISKKLDVPKDIILGSKKGNQTSVQFGIDKKANTALIKK